MFHIDDTLSELDPGPLVMRVMDRVVRVTDGLLSRRAPSMPDPPPIITELLLSYTCRISVQ